MGLVSLNAGGHWSKPILNTRQARERREKEYKLNYDRKEEGGVVTPPTEGPPSGDRKRHCDPLLILRWMHSV